MRARLSVLLMASLFCLSHGLWGCGSGGDGPGSDPTPPPAIDITPPITSVSCSPPSNAAGWNNTPVACKLVVTDNLDSSGVREIHYKIDPAPEIVAPGDNITFNLADEGETLLIYFSVDKANNQEIPNVKTLKIDKSLPFILGTVFPAPNPNGWNTSNLIVKFICSDGLSTIATCPSDIVVLTEGAGQLFSGTTVDKAGNSASASVMVNLDKTPPKVLSTQPTEKASGIDINTDLSTTFSEPMNPLTLTPNTFIVNAEGSKIPGVVIPSRITSTFKPSTNLSFATSYTATLTSDIRDVAGNPLATYVWSFDTRDRTWGTAAVIESNEASATNPQMAGDALGNVMAVWVQGTDIWANRFLAGSAWNSNNAARIEANDGIASNPQVAMDASGNAMAVWAQGNDIWANRYATGSGWNSNNATRIEANDGAASSPQVAMDPSGNAMAVWIQPGDFLQGSPDNRIGIWATLYSAGSGWSNRPTDLRCVICLVDANSPKVAADGLGNATAVWVMSGHIWANRYAFRSVWSRVNSTQIENNAGTASNPQVAMDATGNAIAVWAQGNNIWVNRYVASTLSWEGGVQIEANDAVASNPQVTMDASGNAMVTWAQGNDIWANRYVAGSSWSPINAARIEVNDAVASNPQVAMDASGNAMAVWVQGNDIWANRYVVGKGWGPASLISSPLIEQTTEPASSPQVVMDVSGNAIAIWVQSDGTSPSIWANRFD